ncbi:MAG: hypothetical protein JSS79_01575 [Bacteroidetes bacterium]|nr:hypothetical protein [Bacteroidota bacterium]
MPLKKFVAFKFSLLLSITLLAQKKKPDYYEPGKITFYYNVNWELTTQEKSVVKREAYFNLKDMVFDGVYSDSNADGKVVEEGYYAHGKKSGMQTEYYNDRSIKSTIEYTGGDFIIWQKMNPDKTYEVIRGTGKFTANYYYFFDWYLKSGTMTGEFLNGKKVGQWTYYNSTKVKTDVEHYKNGKLIDRYVFTKNDSAAATSGKEIILSVNAILTESLAFDKTAFTNTNQFFESQVAYPADFNRTVTYPGGIRRLLFLLSEQTGVPENNLLMIKLKIDEHGQILKTNVIVSVDEDTDNRGLEVLKLHEPRLAPAFSNGKPIASTIYLPVSGGEKWLKMLQEAPTEWLLDPNNFLN